MGKQAKSKRKEHVGKGKVTPVQVAFIVDKYLSDNNFSQTRSIFRTEASTLISRSPLQEAPKSLLSLGAMLDEYICLKEQKVMFEQEKYRLEQEKMRVQTLLQGLQHVMSVYNASTSFSMIAPPIVPDAVAPSRSVVNAPSDPTASTVVISQPAQHVNGTAAGMPESMPPAQQNFCTPVSNYQSTSKRKVPNVTQDANQIAKRTRSQLSDKPVQNKGAGTSLTSIAVHCQDEAYQVATIQSSAHGLHTNRKPIQGSSIAKKLFQQSSSPQANSSGPKTPPRALSSNSERLVSPLEMASASNSHNRTSQEITPTNCTIISSETIVVSPWKQKGYYMERSQCISTTSPMKENSQRSTKRDHVKGRLDFDDPCQPPTLENPVENTNSTPESEENDFFDIDLPILDFSLSELLLDFDIHCEDINNSCLPTMNPVNAASGLTHQSEAYNPGADRVLSEYSSTLTEVISDKNMHKNGGEETGIDYVTATKSITTSIQIPSPAKK